MVTNSTSSIDVTNQVSECFELWNLPLVLFILGSVNLLGLLATEVYSVVVRDEIAKF